MEITGQVIEVMPVDSFTKGDKSYDTQDIIIQTQGQYPKKVALHIFGSDRIQKSQVQVGEVITASFDLSSREFTDRNSSRRWSTSVDVWAIRRGAGQQIAPQQGYQQAPQYAPQYAPQPQAPFQPQQPAYQQPAYQPQAPQMPFPPANPNENRPF